MVQALRMPMMGNTMETGLLAEWLVDEGDPVETDQVVAVVESEKAAADVVANRDGRLARVDVAEGEEVPPGTLIGVVLGPDEDIADAPPPRSRIEPGGKSEPGAETGAAGSGTDRRPDHETGARATDSASGATEGDGPDEERVRAAPGARRLADEEGIDLGAVEGTGPEGAVLIADVEAHLPGPADATGGDRGGSEGGRTFLPPSTRRLARELGVDAWSLEGTGAGGRVTESDVRRAAGLHGAAGADTETGHRTGESPPDRVGRQGIAGPPPRDPSRYGVTITEERELTGIRRTVAERMSRSAREAPQVTLNREVAVERAFETAKELDDADVGDDVGFVDLLVGAAVRALRRHPEFNAWYEGERVRLVDEVNVAVAVDAESGLLTPVIREADGRTLSGIASERRRLTDAVLEGRHGMDDLQGGTFTVSNLGPLGVDSFDPILDPPQVAILGVGRMTGGTCTLSLTFDHRVVDGADAARFLDTLAGGLESPSVVVAERASAGVAGERRTADQTGADGSRTASAAGSSSDGPGEGTGHGAVEAAVAEDLADRAREVAAAHGWPVPSFEVRLDGDGPVVTVHRGDEAEGASPATLRRLTYAACRESRYADTVAGLRDPRIDLLSAGD